MNEKPAKGVKGFLLYSPFTHKHFFRVYDKTDKSKFKDYDICAEDIEIEIIDQFTVLRTGKDGVGKLDYSARVLGHNDEPKEKYQ